MDICKNNFIAFISIKVYAYEQSEKYKEGKFIIERAYALKIKFS
jgi:hypothetical protein